MAVIERDAVNRAGNRYSRRGNAATMFKKLTFRENC